jgi:hypothetical protein
MELDELKPSWQRLDQRVQPLATLNRTLVTNTAIRKARWRLAPLIAGASANIVIGAFIALESAGFWIAHLDKAPALIGGIALQVLSTLLMVIGIGRLVLARRVDFSNPVIEIQRALTALQKWDAWSFHAMWAGVCLLAPAIVIAVSINQFGLNFWERAPGYVLANLVVWLALALGPPLLHAWSRRHYGPLAAKIDAFLTSHSVTRARDEIEQVDEFERS